MTEDIGGVPCCNTDLSPSGDLPKDTQTYINAGETTGWIHTIVPTDYGDTCGALLQSYLSDGMSKDDVKMGFQDYFDSSDSE